VLVTLLHEMQKRDAKKGLATLCIGVAWASPMCIARGLIMRRYVMKNIISQLHSLLLK